MIKKTEAFLKETFTASTYLQANPTDRDYRLEHSYRVANIAKAIAEAEGFDMVIPCCIVNGRNGYFPTNNAYEEGGYEAATSNFKAGVADRMIEAGKELLAEIK